MAFARASPMPGSCASSDSEALFRSSLPVMPALLPSVADWVLPETALALPETLSFIFSPACFIESFALDVASDLLPSLPVSAPLVSVTFSFAPESSSPLSAAWAGVVKASVSAASTPSAASEDFGCFMVSSLGSVERKQRLPNCCSVLRQCHHHSQCVKPVPVMATSLAGPGPGPGMGRGWVGDGSGPWSWSERGT